MWEQLEIAAQMQAYWADNQVSVTITFKPEEANQIADCLSAFESELKSVSLLPLNEHGYEQAPYIAAPREEILEYIETLDKLDFSVLTKEDSYANEANKYCSNDGCEI